MKYTGFILAFFSTLICAQLSLANGSICYDKENAFLISSIKGWVADYKEAKKLRLCVVFYLDGHTFDSSPAVFYPNLVGNDKSVENRADFEQFIQEDIDAFKSKKPNLKFVSVGEVKTNNGLSFILKNLLDGPSPNEFESIAYLPAGKSVLMGVLSARKSKEFKKYSPSLKQFLNAIHKIDRASVFDDFKKLANNDANTVNGKGFEDRYTASIGQKLANGLKECTEAKDKGFNAVLQIDENGTIQDWIIEKEDKLSKCVQEKMRQASGMKPPYAPFHVLLEMKIND